MRASNKALGVGCGIAPSVAHFLLCEHNNRPIGQVLSSVTGVHSADEAFSLGVLSRTPRELYTCVHWAAGVITRSNTSGELRTSTFRRSAPGVVPVERYR